MLAVVTACGGGAVTSGSTPVDNTAVHDTASVMGPALRQLVTADTTFGAGFRFAALVVQANTDPAAGDPFGGGAPARPLTDAERRSIEQALDGLGPMTWVADAEAGVQVAKDREAVIGVGEPVLDDRGALVPVSLRCGILCGTWLTYRLTWDGIEWTVEGHEGPVAVS